MKNKPQIILPLHNLYPGMVCNNYKELCQLLEQPVKVGNAKISQLKFFNQHFDLAKNGNSFTILEVYNKILPKEKKVTESTMMKSYLILEDLAKDIDWSKEFTIVYRSQKDLQLTLGICNEAFYDNKKYAKKSLATEAYAKTIFANIPIECVLDFYKEVNSRGYGEIDRLITNLHNQYLVQIEKTYSLTRDTDRRIFTYATDDEHTTIREALADTLLLEKYQRRGKEEEVIRMTEQELYLRKRAKELAKDVLSHEKLRLLNITSYYPVYKFRFSQDLEARKERYGQIIGIKDDFNRLLNAKALKYHSEKTEKNIKKEFAALLKKKKEEIDKDLLELINEGYFYSLRTYYADNRDELIKDLVEKEDTTERNIDKITNHKKDFSINTKELLSDTIRTKLLKETITAELDKEFKEYVSNEFIKIGWLDGVWKEEVKVKYEMNSEF